MLINSAKAKADAPSLNLIRTSGTIEGTCILFILFRRKDYWWCLQIRWWDAELLLLLLIALKQRKGGGIMTKKDTTGCLVGSNIA